MKKSRTQLERRTEAEQALLKAAGELFAERGITQTSLADIGERAGYSRGLVNHHFGSKEVLIEQLAVQSRDRYWEMLNERLAGNQRITTGRDAVLASVDLYLSVFEAPAWNTRATLVLWGANFPRDVVVDGIVDSDAVARTNTARFIRQGQEDGSVSKTVNADTLAAALHGLCRGVVAQMLVMPGAFETVNIRAECRRIATLALGADESSTTRAPYET